MLSRTLIKLPRHQITIFVQRQQRRFCLFVSFSIILGILKKLFEKILKEQETQGKSCKKARRFNREQNRTSISTQDLW